MAETDNSERRSFDELDPDTAELQDPPAASSGARYKLLSPAKLPISRSACLTIPPGLSPSSFLESPVFLSNVKAEPSPTTGTFFKTQMTLGSATSATFSGPTVCSNISTADKKMASSSFEFKPHGAPNMVIADPNYQQSVQVQGQSQPFASVPLVKSENSNSNSNELSLSAPVSVAGPGTSGPTDVDSDELNHPNSGIQSTQFEQKVTAPSVVSADDGYNWRKYGQKHVKGSEFPRSYYKCTHPNCEVKKLFERSHDGQITEIIYKGDHEHPKPQPSRRYNTGAIMPVQEERSDKFSSITARDDKSLGIYGQSSTTNDPNGTPDLSPIGNDDSAEANRISDDMDDDDPFSKRRKMEMGGMDVTPVVKPIREPRVVVQTLSEVDILDDGYRWRKYGQKVVRGNPNPRSYYKCTNNGCPVRKHVERASHDPKAVITTYEGKHNHDVPTAKNSSHDTAGPTGTIPSRTRPEENDAISLDLGVGISSNTIPENRPHEYLHTARPELVGVTQNHHQHLNHHRNSAGLNSIHPAPVPDFYGMVNTNSTNSNNNNNNNINSLNPYGSRENLGEVGRGNGIPSLNPSSYPYPPNMGRILMGP